MSVGNTSCEARQRRVVDGPEVMSTDKFLVAPNGVSEEGGQQRVDQRGCSVMAVAGETQVGHLVPSASAQAPQSYRWTTCSVWVPSHNLAWKAMWCWY
jgi:hypothetical protein